MISSLQDDVESDLEALLPVLMKSDAAIEECTMTQNAETRYGGWAFNKVQVSVAIDCADLCLGNAECKAYTYYASDYPGPDYKKSVCVMRKRKGREYDNDFATSGEKINCPDDDV